MSVSFVVYARQTEALAYDQLQNTGQTLVPTVVARIHMKPDLLVALDKFQKSAEEDLPAQLRSYRYKFYSSVPGGNPDLQPPSDELPILQGFQQDSSKSEEAFLVPAEKFYYYYSPVRGRPVLRELPPQREGRREPAAEP